MWAGADAAILISHRPGSAAQTWLPGRRVGMAASAAAHTVSPSLGCSCHAACSQGHSLLQLPLSRPVLLTCRAVAFHPGCKLAKRHEQLSQRLTVRAAADSDITTHLLAGRPEVRLPSRCKRMSESAAAHTVSYSVSCARHSAGPPRSRCCPSTQSNQLRAGLPKQLQRRIPARAVCSGAALLPGLSHLSRPGLQSPCRRAIACYDGQGGLRVRLVGSVIDRQGRAQTLTPASARVSKAVCTSVRPALCIWTLLIWHASRCAAGAQHART